MTYCSLQEAYGDDFEIQNVNTSKKFETGMNPNRNNYANSRTHNVSNIQSFAHQLKNQDYKNHKATFHSSSLYGEKSEGRTFEEERRFEGGRRFEAEPPVLKHSNQLKAWGNVQEDSPYKDISVSDENPRDMLKRSLMRDRPSYDLTTSSHEPAGYNSEGTYKLVRRHSKCRDYFHHLDTCKKCQDKLKKRVIKYFNLLQKSKNKQILPGSNGMNANLVMDRELFHDNDHDVNNIKVDDIKVNNIKFDDKTNNQKNNIEGFSDYSKEKNKNKNILMLMVFGLITIYVMDSLKN